MSDEHPAKKPRPWWHWALAATGTAAFIVLLIWGPWWIEGHHLRDGKGNLVSSAGIIVTGFRTMLVAIAAGGFTAAGLWYTHRSHQHTEKLFEHTREKDREQTELTREGQVTGRYVEAVKLLASDKITERLGGIYALQRIMGDSQKDHETVIKVLAAFLREPPNDDEGMISGDRQAAFTVIAHRPPYSGPGSYGIDLQGAYLEGAISEGGNWENADFKGANLASASLVDIYAKYANFSAANLDGADLHNSAMYHCRFEVASLVGTILPGSMDGCSFNGTDLRNIANPKVLLNQRLYTDEGTKLPTGNPSFGEANPG
ncbi:pentapeptide repeat-containing protein [Streptomyces sp. NPDC005302]|uniref:pentapeptide repeat-containing protein n=1 Tax=Streptomyces sp. NPDC005302 TaxID=3154675 RepID=UPI0033B84E8D